MVKPFVRKLSGEQKKAGGEVKEVQQSNPSTLAELKAARKAQQDTVRRIAELKLRLLHLTETHWEQSISVLKRWIQ